MSSKSFWIAFIAGTTAGAIVALLYAPQTGAKTRKQLGRAYDEAGDTIEDATDYVKDQAERLSKEANSAYKKGVKQLDDAYSKAIDALNDSYADAKDKLVSVADVAIDNVETITKKARSLV
jgi:gas vesicle protein